MRERDREGWPVVRHPLALAAGGNPAQFPALVSITCVYSVPAPLLTYARPVSVSCGCKKAMPGLKPAPSVARLRVTIWFRCA